MALWWDPIASPWWSITFWWMNLRILKLLEVAFLSFLFHAHRTFFFSFGHSVIIIAKAHRAFLYARHCSRFIPYNNSFHLYNNPMRYFPLWHNRLLLSFLIAYEFSRVRILWFCFSFKKCPMLLFVVNSVFTEMMI